MPTATITAADAAPTRSELRLQRRRIVRRLRETGGNVKRVARELGVSRHLVTSLRDFHQIPSSPIRAIDEEYQRQQDAIVRHLHEAGGNVAATARAFGVTRERVRRLRELHGIPASVVPSPERRRGPREDERAKVEAVLAATGGNVKRAVAETGIAESTVRRWKTERTASWHAIDASLFYANTRRDEDTGCLLWTGQTAKGYGVTNLGGTPRRAHRVAYELKRRTALGSHEHVHHLCRNTLCVETTHLLAVADAGEYGHNALHRLEDAFTSAVEGGELARDLAAVEPDPARWPEWLNERAMGSLRADETLADA